MKCSCREFMKNICSRLVYTIFIAGIVFTGVIFLLDTLFVTYPFSTNMYKPKAVDANFSYISEPYNLTTQYFKFPLPGVAQIVMTLSGEKCLVFDQNNKKSIEDLADAKLYESKSYITFLEINSITCIDSISYDLLVEESFIYTTFNTILLITMIVFIVIMTVLLLALWICCKGFYGCQCCAIFVICCDPKIGYKQLA